MALIRIDAESFYNVSSYNCVTKGLIVYTDATHETVATSGWSHDTSTPSTVTKIVQFEHGLPENSGIVSAKVHATLGSSLYGAAVCTINGVAVAERQTCEVDVTDTVEAALAAGEPVVSVPFVFQSNAVEHEHPFSELTLTDSYWVSNTYWETYTKMHSGSLSYKDVYLLIETTGGGCIYRAEGDKLVPYRLCRAEGGKLVPYQLHRAEGGKLVPY